jgi:hypothetical protein
MLANAQIFLNFKQTNKQTNEERIQKAVNRYRMGTHSESVNLADYGRMRQRRADWRNGKSLSFLKEPGKNLQRDCQLKLQNIFLGSLSSSCNYDYLLRNHYRHLPISFHNIQSLHLKQFYEITDERCANESVKKNVSVKKYKIKLVLR